MAVKKAVAPPKARTSKPAVSTVPLEPLLSEEGPGTFEEISERMADREAGLTPVRKAVREKHDQEVVEAASSATVDGVVRMIGDLRVGVNSALDTLSADLMAEARRLSEIEEAIALRSRHLASFYEIEVAADTLGSLIAAHDKKRAEFELAASAREQDLEQRLETLQKEFEARMAEERAAWEAEARKGKASIEEEKTLAAKEWSREQEEHEYSRKLRWARDEEEFKAKRASLQASLADEKARADAQLLDREQHVALQEKELGDLRTRVDAFPADLERAVQQARTEAASAVEQRTAIQVELRAKDADSNEKLLKLRIQGLEQAVKDLASRNESLQQELREATDKVRDIAMKAIEGASGATALSRVSEIALQHAKGREG